MSRFQVHVAQTRSEMEAIMDCQWAAFVHEDLMRAIYAYDPADPPTLAPAIAFSKNAVWTQHEPDPTSNWLYVVDTSKRGADAAHPFVVGSAQWRIFDRNPYPNGSPLPKPAVYADGSASQTFVGKWIRAAMAGRVRYMSRPHAALGWLGVRPEYRRMGIGNLITAWGTAKADEMGLEATLSASPEGRHLYVKHGFVEIDRTILDLPDLCETVEEREACRKLASTNSWDACTMWRPVGGKLLEGYEEQLQERVQGTA